MRDSSDERTDQSTAPNRRNVLKSAVPGDGVKRPERRGVLKGAVVSIAAALGFADAAAARVDPGRRARLRGVRRRYRSESAALEALETRGADVLDRLVEEGYLSTADAADLGAPEVNAVETDGTFTAHVAADAQTEDGRLRVVVEPEADRQYAILDHDDREEFTVFAPGELDDPSPQCIAGYGCEGGGCVCDEWRVLQCSGGDCFKDRLTGGTCSGCVPCSSPACGF